MIQCDTNQIRAIRSSQEGQQIPKAPPIVEEEDDKEGEEGGVKLCRAGY